MRKTAIVLAAVLAGSSIVGCQADIPQNIEENKEFILEVGDFFKNDDLSETLGISDEESRKIEDSIKSYIENYSMDDENLQKAKESVNELLEDAQGLSADELQSKITEIFKK